MYLGIDLGTSELKLPLGDDGRVIDTEGSALAPGQGFISLGTSGVMFVVTDRFRPNPAQAVHAFCHTLDGGTAGGALGAARLAALACGRSEANVCAAPAVLHSYLPGAEKAALLQQRLALFAQLYPRLKDLHLPSA